MSLGLVAAAAEASEVCSRPVLRVVTDRVTRREVVVAIPCGSTRESVCGPCARKAARLRMHQCREGWHLTDDPQTDPGEDAPAGEAVEPEDDDDEDDELEDQAGSGGEPRGRRVRSTARLAAFPDLPRVAMSGVTIGRTYTDPATGREFRPSMFVTLTLPSRGKIRPGTGTPVNPGRYDYRRAALDAMLFPRLVDRWWQNLRRCAGYRVQYFAAVEPQRRLAPHLHAAIRGAIPRKVLRQVAAATYAAVWWPSLDRVVYDEARGDTLPRWDYRAGGYLHEPTGVLLPTWEEALDAADQADEPPAHVLRFGRQFDIKGILGGTEESDRAVRYLCKYLTKSVAETHTPDPDDGQDDQVEAEVSALAGRRAEAGYRGHMARLAEEVRWLPCSERCANWLRYGVQPLDATPGMMPGFCPAKAHDPEHLGIGGRRVLVSRDWTGKTLSEHRADRAAVVRETLTAAGYTPEEADRMAADVLHTDGQPRYVWRAVPVASADYTLVMAANIQQAQQWRAQYDHARQVATARFQGPPGRPVESHSAIRPGPAPAA